MLVAGYNWLRSPGLFCIYSVAILCIVTAVALNNSNQYDVEIEQLLSDNRFTQMSKYWRHHGDGSVSAGKGTLIVENSTVGGSHRVNQRIPIAESGVYRLSVDVETYADELGEEQWEAPSVRVFFRNSFGDTVGGVVVVRHYKSMIMSNYSKVFVVPNETKILEVSISLINSVAAITVVNPVLSKVNENTGYQRLRLILLAGWLISIVALAVYLMPQINLGTTLVLAVLGALTLIGTLVPESTLLPFVDWLYLFIPEAFKSPLDIVGGVMSETVTGVPSAVLSKLGHFFVFSVIGFVVAVRSKPHNLLPSLAGILLFAVVTEVLQLFVSSRNSSLNDFVIDSAGVFAGICAGLVVNRLILNQLK